jgi:biopolymer transport protein ExbD
MLRTALFMMPALGLLMLTSGCQTPGSAVPMPPDLEAGNPATDATPAAPTPSAKPDYTLHIGKYQTSMEELAAGTLSTDKPVTIQTSPDVPYERIVEILTQVSELGYLVEFKPTP